MYLSVALAALTSFKPGEPDAILSCKSASGRTIFKALLHSCSYLGDAEFSIDGSQYSFSDKDFCGVVFDPGNKVFTIYLESKDVRPQDEKFIQFWALPNTIRIVKSEQGPGNEFHDVYNFRAKIYGTEPRTGFENNTKTIELICTLDYEL